jgi:hypothetical protein
MATKAATKKTDSTVKKAAEKIVETEKAVVKAATETATKVAEKKAVVRKKPATAKKAEMTTEVFVQYWGKEVNAAEVSEQVKKIWTDEMKKDLADLKELKIYIKPEDDGAHYVINGEITGFIKM